MENRKTILKFSNSLLLPITIMVDNKRIKSLRPLKGEEILLPIGHEIKIKNFLHSKTIKNLNDGIFYIDKGKIKWIKIISIFLFPFPFIFIIESTFINILFVLVSFFTLVFELNNFVIKDSDNESIAKQYNGIPKLTSKSLFNFAK